MNQNLLDLGGNNAAVTDEHGTVTLVKANDGNKITAILLKENTIEDLTKKLNGDKKALKRIRKDNIGAPFAKALGFFAVVLSWWVGTQGIIPPLLQAVCLGLSAMGVCGIYLDYGFKVSRIRRRARIIADIENTNKSIQTETAELEALKSEAAYETTMDEPKQLEEAPVTITYDGTVKSREFAPVRVLKLR